MHQSSHRSKLASTDIATWPGYCPYVISISHRRVFYKFLVFRLLDVQVATVAFQAILTPLVMLSRTSIVCRLPLKAPKRKSAIQLRANTTEKLTQNVLTVYPSELEPKGMLK